MRPPTLYRLPYRSENRKMESNPQIVSPYKRIATPQITATTGSTASALGFQRNHDGEAAMGP